MPGVTRELSNPSDFRRVTSPSGDEVIPAVTPEGEPVAITASAAFSTSIEGTLLTYVGDDEANFLQIYEQARDTGQ